MSPSTGEPAPPAEFSHLSKAYNSPKGTFVSVMGVVVDIMAPSTTRTGEWVFTFKLLDPNLRDSIYGSSQGMTVRFFKKDHQHLPRVRSLGDVVLIRNIKSSPYNQQPLLLGNYQTTTVVFPAASIPDPTFQIAYQGSNRLECLGVPLDKELVTLEEQSYAIALHNALKDTVEGLPSTNKVGFGADDLGSTALNEPPAKRARLSEPVLQAQPPPNAPSGSAAVRSRQSDGIPLPATRNSSFGPKFKTVKELAHFQFADVCAQVVKKYPLPYGGCDLYVSDYTENKEMWYYTPPEEDKDIERDGDMFGYSGGPPKRQFPGPYGWNVLKVNVKDPHAHFVNHKLVEGDFLLLRNVKMKIQREGAKLEGDMWPDSVNPEKVMAIKLMNHDLPEIQDLLRRKEKYWASRKSKVENQENAKLSKSEKRSKKKKQKAEKKAAEAGALDNLLKAKSKPDINPHVRCSNDEVPITSVRGILDPDNERHTNSGPVDTNYIIPFINAKYRARVRVVDYEPKTLEDFAIPTSPADDADDKSIMSIDDQLFGSSNQEKYEWSFRLLLEDASAANLSTTADDRLWLTFDHESAQYLFGNSMEDPADLRADAQLLAKLREKMYILWGDLEERKGRQEEGAKVSNRPFECCVREYGVQVDGEEGENMGEGISGVGFGYRRVFGGFGVTIT